MTKRDIFKACEAADLDARSGPHGWIQWKGTNVCLDVYCACGEHTHLDAEFAYRIQCGECGRVYATCATIRLVELTPEEIAECTATAAVRILGTSCSGTAMSR